MLPNTLNTNEVKNSSGTEVEFSRRLTNGSTTEFVQVAETPNLPHRMRVAHTEVGKSAGARRRSLVQFSKTVQGVDGQPARIVAQCTVDFPVGNLATMAEPTNVLAELQSFLSTTGAGTTVLFNGTGNGAVCLLNGDL